LYRLARRVSNDGVEDEKKNGVSRHQVLLRGKTSPDQATLEGKEGTSGDEGKRSSRGNKWEKKFNAICRKGGKKEKKKEV